MANLYAVFKKLIPNAPLLVGTVVEAYTGGATVTLQGGGLLRVRGAATVGQRVFVRDGVIEGEAPDLPLFQIEID